MIVQQIVLRSLAQVMCRELRMCQLSQAEVSRFYAVHAGKDFYQRLIEFMSSGKIVAMELLAAGIHVRNFPGYVIPWTVYGTEQIILDSSLSVH